MERCEVSRGSLAASCIGPDDGAPVLLVAGGGGAIWGWARLLPGLAPVDVAGLHPVPGLLEGCRVAAFDQAGVGGSVDVPPARTAREYAADALAVGRELLGERFTVVGLSLGGAAALHLALEAPDAVGSLVLACTFAGMRSYAGHDLGPPPTVPPAPARIDPRLVEASGAHAPSFSQSFLDGSAELFWEIVRLSEATPTRPDLDDVQIEQFASHDVVDRLGEIAVPTEVICGALDRTMPLGNSRLLAGEIADSRLTVVPEAGHALHMETPTRLAGAIRAAVDRWVRS